LFGLRKSVFPERGFDQLADLLTGTRDAELVLAGKEDAFLIDWLIALDAVLSRSDLTLNF
jgi:hypothetical protein